MPQHISAIEQEKWASSITLLPKLAEELEVTTDFLLGGKEGVVTDVIPAIKANRSLTLKAKRALMALYRGAIAGKGRRRGNFTL